MSVDGDLCALIKARQLSREQKMDNFIDSLEEKYANGKGKRNPKRGARSDSGKASGSRKHRTVKGKGRKKM